MKALVMAGSGLRRLARDRLALFFLVLLPVVIILIVGLAFGDAGSERLPVGVAEEGAGRLGSELGAELEASPALDARAYADADALGKAVRRGVVAAGVVVPAGYDEALRAGRRADVTFVTDQTRPAPAPVRSAVAAVVARQAAEVKAARLAAETAGVPFDTAWTGHGPWPAPSSRSGSRRPPSAGARTRSRPGSTTPPRPTWSLPGLVCDRNSRTLTSGDRYSGSRSSSRWSHASTSPRR